MISKLKSRFTYPSQNWEKVARLLKTNQKISFFSWECPPRQIVDDPAKGGWVNFDVDIKAIVDGKKIDAYTELPRLTAQVEKESWLIKTLNLPNPNFSYTKIVADTNGLYLYTKSRGILGSRKIKKLAREFAKTLTTKARLLYPTYTPKIVLFTSLMLPFKKKYESFFELVYKNQNLVPKEIYSYWLDRMINHVGLNTNADKLDRLDLLKRVVASYAAEGMILSLLDQNKSFPNPVWINWEEKPESAITTEILRRRYGIPPLPVLYFLDRNKT